jgi:hypothetical protein
VNIKVNSSLYLITKAPRCEDVWRVEV